MQRLDRVIRLVLILVVMLPVVAAAQSSSINAYSPYSMYGPGELLTPGTVSMRSMGGVGIAQRNAGYVNMLNPAASSVVPTKSFLFDMSFDGTHFRNNQPKYDPSGALTRTAKTVYNSVNIHNFAIAFPLAKNFGATLSLAPYSSVGYKMHQTDQQADNWADIGRVVYGHMGDGDITEVKLSLGWAPWRNFSIGIAAKYFWGNIERTYSASVANMVTGSGIYSTTTGKDNYVVSNFKMQVGAQWNIIFDEKRIFTLGATYDLGGRLNPKRASYVYTDNTVNTLYPSPIRDQVDRMELRVPHQIGAGLYFQNRTIAWGVDYNYAMWGDANKDFTEGVADGAMVVAYTDTHHIKAGFEITPRRNDVRNYLNRMSYRVGARLGNYYQTFAGERINQLAITAGIGFPVKVWGASSVNVAFEYGRQSAPKAVDISGAKVGLVTQNYYKISVGFSLFSADTSDYWFVRQKYD